MPQVPYFEELTKMLKDVKKFIHVLMVPCQVDKKLIHATNGFKSLRSLISVLADAVPDEGDTWQE